MVKNVQITVLVLIIGLSVAFICYKVFRPPVPVVVEEPKIEDLNIATTAPDTYAPLSLEQAKQLIDATTAPVSKKTQTINK